MRLEDVLTKVTPVTGMTTLVNALGGGDLKSISNRLATSESTIGGALEKLAAVRADQEACRSDAAWWGYEGQRSYWEMVVNLLKAAEIVGPDNLPEVPVPDPRDKVVMDIYGDQEDFGKEVLRRAESGQARAS